jgi:hypothetical protein
MTTFSIVALILHSLSMILAADNFLVFNLLSDENNSIVPASDALIAFLRTAKADGFQCGKTVACQLFTQEKDFKLIDQTIRDELTSYVSKIDYFSLIPAVDNTVGFFDPRYEHVSDILGSLKEACSQVLTSPKEGSLVSLSFSTTSFPIYTQTFRELFEVAQPNKDIIILEKNKELSSVSDWHDVMVIAVNLRNLLVKDWVDSSLSLFRKHAVRPAYSLLEPRPALIEATIRARGKVHVSYFRRSDICIRPFATESAHHDRGSFCGEGGSDSATLTFSCGTKDSSSSHICSTIHTPQHWKKRGSHHDHDITYKAGSSYQDIKECVPRHSRIGPIRFRLAPDAEKPLDFCWNTGCTLLPSDLLCFFPSLMATSSLL